MSPTILQNPTKKLDLPPVCSKEHLGPHMQISYEGILESLDSAFLPFKRSLNLQRASVFQLPSFLAHKAAMLSLQQTLNRKNGELLKCQRRSEKVDGDCAYSIMDEKMAYQFICICICIYYKNLLLHLHLCNYF